MWVATATLLGRFVRWVLFLSAHTNADRGEGAEETDIAGVARVYPTVHRTEEEIGAVAKTDLGIGAAESEIGETADIGYDDGA